MEPDSSVNSNNINNYGTLSYDDYSNEDLATYYSNLCLRLFAANLVEMLTKHAKFKELCLEHENPEAHYIEGVIQYFIHEDKHKGLRHLRQSSIGNNDNGTYLYGLLLLARGHYPKGKKCLDKLQWKENLSTSNQCWERIKNSLRDIIIEFTNDYYANMINLQPYTNCHPQDNQLLVCERCYYYKRVNLFYLFCCDDD